MKLYQGKAPAICYKGGKLLYEFNDRRLETDDADLIAILLSLGAVEIVEETPEPTPGGCSCNPDDWYTKAEIDRKLEAVAAGDLELDAYATDEELAAAIEAVRSDSRPITNAEIDDIIYG